MSAPPAPRAPERRIEFYRHALGDDEAASVRETLSTLFLALGPRVAAFEEALGQYLVAPRSPASDSPVSGSPVSGSPASGRTDTGTTQTGPAFGGSAFNSNAPHVIGTNSNTMGQLVALRALGVGPGDEVITSPMTFASTLLSILHAGARPVLVDVEPTTGLMDVAAARAAIGPKTRGIVCVHLYGQLCDMHALSQLARAHGLFLLEDSAHGIEMERDGVRPGELGDAAVFSFYTTKNLTSGDGGAIVTRDASLATRMRLLRNHGVSKSALDRHGGGYEHWDLLDAGFKANMTDIDAALLLPQLGKVEARRARREALVRRYEHHLARLGDRVARPDQRVPWLIERRGRSSHHLFTVHAPRGLRDATLVSLNRQGIGAAVNYRAVHGLTYFRERLERPVARWGELPVAEEMGDRTLSLPLYPTLADDAVDEVARALRAALEAP